MTAVLKKFGWCFLMLLSGCYETSTVDTVVQGYVPIYGSREQSTIELVSSQPINNPGKIYVYGQFLLVNEVKEGIHIFDNINPATPKPIGFIRILGNIDMAIKDNVLYADHMGDLVALDVSDFKMAKTTGRLPLHTWFLGVPPPVRSSFECVNPEMGLVVSWRKAELKNPECYAF